MTKSPSDRTRCAQVLLHVSFAALVAVLLPLVAAGCGSEPLSYDPGDVSLNQLWGAAAEATDSHSSGAILVGFEMTLAPDSSSSEQAARVEVLHAIAFAHGLTVDLIAGSRPSGLGEVVIRRLEAGNDPMPLPAGYPVAELFSTLDYCGMPRLLAELQRHTGETAVRLRMTYPPVGPKTNFADAVPLLLLRERTIEPVESMHLPQPEAPTLQVLAVDGEEMLALLVVAGE